MTSGIKDVLATTREFGMQTFDITDLFREGAISREAALAAARVEVFPEPVARVTRTRPRPYSGIVSLRSDRFTKAL